MTNGNQKLKIINWNKGNAKLSNIINTIQSVIIRYQPHIIALQEVNYTSKQTPEEIIIPGYKWEFDQLLQQHGRARSALLIKDSIRYVRRNELETKDIAHVWITVHLQGNKKLNIQSYYRQWQKMGIHQRIMDTDSISSQKERLQAVATKWKQALDERESYSFSDTNLNLRNLGTLPTQMNSHDRKHYPLLLVFQTMILNEGAGVIPTDDTRYNPQTKITEFLDHCVTNYPDKIINKQINKTGDSDHYIGEFTIETKVKTTIPRYILSRKFELINWDVLKLKLYDEQRLKDVSQLTDPSEICLAIQETINKYLEEQAPVRKIQISNKFPNFTSQETRELINQRDVALEDAKEKDDPESWRLFRNLRNRVHKGLSSDKKNDIKDKLDDKNNVKDKWKSAKDVLGWNRSPQPTILIDHGIPKTKPKDIANAMNFNLISKAN